MRRRNQTEARSEYSGVAERGQIPRSAPPYPLGTGGRRFSGELPMPIVTTCEHKKVRWLAGLWLLMALTALLVTITSVINPIVFSVGHYNYYIGGERVDSRIAVPPLGFACEVEAHYQLVSFRLTGWCYTVGRQTDR